MEEWDDAWLEVEVEMYEARFTMVSDAADHRLIGCDQSCTSAGKPLQSPAIPHILHECSKNAA